MALVPPTLIRQLDATLAEIRKLPAPPPPPEGEATPEGEEDGQVAKEAEETT
jgi:hypothetical protein